MKNNGNLMRGLKKFLLAFNEMTEEANAIEEIVSADETESGTVVVKYEIEAGKFIEVGADGIVSDNEGNQISDGEYKLTDGSILKIEGGRFVGVTPVGSEEETKEAVAPVATSLSEPKEEEKKEEQMEETVEIPATLVDVEINGVSYKVQQEVADYIAELEKGKTDAEEQVESLKKVTPSATPAQGNFSNVSELTTTLIGRLKNHRN